MHSNEINNSAVCVLETVSVVPIAEFMKFNRIKELAATPDDIEKALYNSDFLELSCDKQRIRRTTVVRSKDNIDELTVYVVRARR